MASLNKVMLMGNLTRDPELRYTPSGMAVCNLGVAVNRTWKNKNGQAEKETTFLRVTVWGKTGENCASYLKKGRGVFVEGRLQSRSWEDDSGKKQSALDVVAERVEFLNDGQQREQGGDQPDDRSHNERVSGPQQGGGQQRQQEQQRINSQGRMPQGDHGDCQAGVEEDDIPF